VLQQPSERGGRQRQEPAGGDGFDRSGPRPAAEERPFAEDIALAVVGEVAPLAAAVPVGAQPALLDHVERAGGVALLDHDVPRLDGDRLQGTQQLGQRLTGKAGERRVL
jgi:hypothetical protein